MFLTDEIGVFVKSGKEFFPTLVRGVDNAGIDRGTRGVFGRLRPTRRRSDGEVGVKFGSQIIRERGIRNKLAVVRFRISVTRIGDVGFLVARDQRERENAERHNERKQYDEF